MCPLFKIILKSPPSPGWRQMCPPGKIRHICYIFAFCTTKMYQGTLVAQRCTLIGSRTRHGPSMDPAMALQYTWHGPLYIGYIFAFYATKMGSRDSGDTQVDPHMVLDPPWSFNGPCHGPTIQYKGPCLVCCRAMAGSIEGPRRVLDQKRMDLCIPRVPWSKI